MFLVELMKPVCVIPFLETSKDDFNIKKAVRFLLPSLLYAINNNIYYYGITLVPPPIWIILLSFRTIITATLYKVRKDSCINN